LTDTIIEIYEKLRDQWTGCTWSTEFGAARLNLNGVTCRQAALLARATSGEESALWREAAEYLATIEADAAAARVEAGIAAQKAEAGSLPEALAHAERACDLERPYHSAPVWEALLNALHHLVPSSGKT
jgi:hypothetical protein